MAKIGVDFGTTHTSAAYYDPQNEQLRFFALDSANGDQNLLRSMLYITREQAHLLGREAVETYLREDTGRIARYEEKMVGTIENTVAQTNRGPTDPGGPIHIIYDVIIEEDVSANGRLIQSVKTGLRDPDYDGTNIFDRFYTLSELISLILVQVRTQAEAQLGEKVTAVTLGRPVKFAEDEEVDRQAEQKLREAAEMAGFTEIDFEKEPIAAALFYTHTLTKPETVFVFDFGGGTLDMTVMRVNPGEPPQMLATQGVLVGGDDLDSALMRGKVASHFGTTSAIDQDGAPFPLQVANMLNRWQTIPTLSRAENLSLIRRAKQYGDNPAAFHALEVLAKQNYGFSLFQHIETAKRTLSVEEQATIQMTVGEAIQLDVPITRREFQAGIVTELANVQRGLSQVLKRAGIFPDEVNTVVTTGGSSLIPIFQMILRKKFSQAQIVQSDTFGSVTAGLALRASGQTVN